jgi:hypothetical protein
VFLVGLFEDMDCSVNEQSMKAVGREEDMMTAVRKRKR